MAATDPTSSDISSSVATLGDDRAVGALADTSVPWFEIERRARRRRIVSAVSVAGALLVAVSAAVLWNANAHYARGRDMLADGRYATAVDEFAAARFFSLPYRDAAALEASAQRSLSAALTEARADRRLRATVTRLLEKAEEGLAQGNAAGVVAAVAAARRVVPDGPLPLAVGSEDLTTRLVRLLHSEASGDLAAGHWNRATQLATANLAVLPSDGDAADLLAAARTGAALQARLDKARSAAAAGRWRIALRLAQAVLAARKGFPGAAAVVAEARIALAPKPAPRPTAASAPAASSSSAGATAAAPPPP